MMIRQRSNVLIIIQLLQIKSKIIPSSKQSLLKTCHFYEISFFFCLITNTIEIKDSTKQNQYSESIYIYIHTHTNLSRALTSISMFFDVFLHVMMMFHELRYSLKVVFYDQV